MIHLSFPIMMEDKCRVKMFSRKKSEKNANCAFSFNTLNWNMNTPKYQVLTQEIYKHSRTICHKNENIIAKHVNHKKL